eukprot:jgi/Botrbrau1/7768/Bobra.0159s0196.1
MAATGSALQLTATENKPAYVKPYHPVEGPTVWYGKDINLEDVAYNLTEEDLRDLELATNAVLAANVKLENTSVEKFPLGVLGPKLEAIHKDLIYGRGVRILKGLPLAVDKSSVEYAVTALWLVSNYFGNQQPLTQCGHLVGHVRTDGGKLAKLTNCSPTKMAYHADNADVVFLACRTPAKSGGANSLVSTHALHNEILKRRPDLHKVLAEPFYVDRRDWIPEGAPPYYKIPFFHYHENTLGVQEIGGDIEEVARCFPGVPPVKPIQVEALNYVQELASDYETGLRIDIALEPGDVLILHNLTVFHSRTAWEDGSNEDEKRHMFRIWSASPLGWPLDPSYAERWVTTEVGKRGGLSTPGLVPHVAFTHTQYHEDLYEWQLKYGATATTERFKGAPKPEVLELLKKFYPYLVAEPVPKDAARDALPASKLNTVGGP